MAALPVIDLANYSDEAAFLRLADEIGAACREIGFFYVINHGVDLALMDKCLHEAKVYFALPEEEKMKLDKDIVGGGRGYWGFGTELHDKAKGPDNKESFSLSLDLAADDPDIVQKKPFRILNQWPTAVPEFKDTMNAYYNACMKLGERIQRAFAQDLKLPLDYFTQRFSKPMGALRILHYPPAPKDAQFPPGIGTHTDYGGITLLATDDCGGLEVRKRSGEWVSPAPIPGAFIVNIGDCMMRWTNDVYVSTPHRVIHTNPDRSRYSAAFFYDANPDALVETVPSCIPEGQKAKYPPILASDYLQWRLNVSLGLY